MPFKSSKQRAWAHTDAGKRAGFTPERIAQWDAETPKSLPTRAPKVKKKNLAAKKRRA
jgi:hypothetical protein